MLELTLHECFWKIYKADKGYNDQASMSEPQKRRVMRPLILVVFVLRCWNNNENQGGIYYDNGAKRFQSCSKNIKK
jgi:hypothetical protein